jgi:predicted AAA+ superfamily ATPase
MEYVKRAIEKGIIDSLSSKHKVVLVFGARRVGKTEMAKRIINNIKIDFLLLNGEDIEHRELLQNRSANNYTRMLGKKQLLVIDEAQAIPEIGLKLKLMIDTIPGIKILVTGSSSFELNNQVGEPLVGRKIEYSLFPFAQMELLQKEDYLMSVSNLEERLIFGGYPELIQLPERNDKIEYLKEMINAYLLKDIIAFEGIKKRDKIINLLKIIAFRVGSEISMEGIGRELQISKNTVDRYLDLLSKVFILHKVTGFSRNLDNEITKKAKWYFYDNGIRNAIISSFNPLHLRDDIGTLWENYFISERIKYQSYRRLHINNYFWRHKNKQEIDWVEESSTGINAYEIKWNQNAKVNAPSIWKRAYPGSKFTAISRNNYLDFISDTEF